MKTTKRFAITFAVLAFALNAQEKKAALGSDGSTTAVDLEVGAQTRQVDGKKSFGFQQYRDMPQGAFLRRFDFRFFSEGKPLHFSFSSIDLMQRDQRFTATVDDVGRQKLEFRWDGFSRYWSNRDPFVLSEVRRGVFTAPAALRSSLENAPDGATLASLAADALANAPKIEIRSFRERKFVNYDYNLSDSLSLRLEYLHDRRSGNRMFSQGSYVRLGASLGDTFETPGQEMYEPTAYGTNEFRVGLNYRKKRWMADFDYRASLFSNHTKSLVWQNPFRLTSVSANPPDGAINRGRFAASQVALPPDNQAHTLTAAALVLLPRSSKASGLISWGRWTQNEAFLPYTINPAIVAGNLPSGVLPTSLSALPRQGLQGLIHNLTQDYAFTSRPARLVQLNFRYNDYDLKNETPEITFPGYSAYGDSFWRTAISGQPGTAAVPIRSDPKSFHRKRAQVEGAVRPTRALTWKGAYRWDRLNRENREVEHMTEHGLLTSFSYAPSNSAYAQGGFRYFTRKPDVYDPGTLEPPFLRMFDQAERKRRQGDLLLSTNLSSKAALSASWYYVADTYDKTFFGLHQQKIDSVSADFTLNPGDNVGLFAGWGYDRTGYDYLTVTKTSFPYSFANSWSRDTRDGVHSAHVGLSGSASGGKLTYQVNYAMALARTLINATNPNQVVANQVLNAQAFAFPEVKNRFHELRLDSSYEVRKSVRLGVYWLLEPYRLTDFARDVVVPYAAASVPPENDARRFMFLDSGPTSYTGNMVAVYLRFSFN